jgi:hypothetical protein
MKPKDVIRIKNAVDGEGFDYAFVHYSDFKEIDDEEFHTLRKAFVSAREALAEYCGLEGV